jgi:hypothetical protein
MVLWCMIGPWVLGHCYMLGKGPWWNCNLVFAVVVVIVVAFVDFVRVTLPMFIV